MLRSITGTRRRRAVAVLAGACLAAGAASAVVMADGQNPEPQGQFSFSPHVIVGCPVGAVLCTNVTYTGDIQGSGPLVLLAIVPSPTVGVNYFNGKQTIHTAQGDLRCDLNGATNTLGAQGEFGEICSITGGTGAYAHAKGHLRMFGTSTNVLGIPTGSGDYKASITL